MDNKNCKEKVLLILKGINPNVSGAETENLLENGTIDSFEIVNVVMELEEAFGIEIDLELIVPDNFKTVTAITGVVEKSLRESNEDM